MHKLSYFDYLLLSAIVSICIGLICLLILPPVSIYSLSQQSDDKASERSVVCNVFGLCSSNKIFVCMMSCAAMDALLASSMNLLIGPYFKDIYKFNPFELGIYVTLSIGTAEIASNLIIVPYVANKSRCHILIFIGCLIEFFGIAAWNVLHRVDIPPFSIVLCTVAIIFFGHELVFSGIMFKNQQIAHQSQQLTLVSFWSVVMTVSGSMGNIVVGELYDMDEGISTLLIILALTSAAGIFASSVLCYFQLRKSTKEIELTEID